MPAGVSTFKTGVSAGHTTAPYPTSMLTASPLPGTPSAGMPATTGQPMTSTSGGQFASGTYMVLGSGHVSSMGTPVSSPSTQWGLAPSFPTHQLQPNVGGIQPAPGSTASFRSSPLTQALAPQLGYSDPDSLPKGITLRPEFHVQHVMNSVPLKNINYKNLSLIDPWLGMCKVCKCNISRLY